MERDPLIGFLNTIHPCDENSLIALITAFEPVTFGRKTVVTQSGEVERYLYFVDEGYQRSYFPTHDKEHVMAFTYAPSFSGIPESFITGNASPYVLETITPSRMRRISRDDLNAIMLEHRAVETLMRKATEAVLAGVTLRHHEHLSMTIEQRFRAFMRRSGHLVNAIPHKHIASYLGMDATNFSRLLSGIRL